MKNWTLYILRCEQGKYYVGITSQTPKKRLWQHQQKIIPAYWTIKYPPKEIIYSESLGQIPKALAEKRENKMVRACAKKYGLNNVRGGDLKDTEDYIIRFGYVYKKEDWLILMYGIFFMIMFFAFYTDKYIYSFIPGVVS